MKWDAVSNVNILTSLESARWLERNALATCAGTGTNVIAAQGKRLARNNGAGQEKMFSCIETYQDKLKN